MPKDILGYIIQKQTNSPSGISVTLTHMEYSKQEDGYVLYMSCPLQYRQGVYSELEDANLVNVFATRVINLLISLGLPAEECRKFYCDDFWIKVGRSYSSQL